jgi:hypothetical protein
MYYYKITKQKKKKHMDDAGIPKSKKSIIKALLVGIQ